MLGRADVATDLRARFDVVNKAMLATLWNETEGLFQNCLSTPLAPITRLAPTHFYPLLAGPDLGPSEAQVVTTVKRVLTNNTKMAVWPSGTPPADLPPLYARPLVQWYSQVCDSRGDGCLNGPHALCCQLDCNFQYAYGNMVQRAHAKVRYEGMALSRVDSSTAIMGGVALVPLYNYNCTSNATTTTIPLIYEGHHTTATDAAGTAEDISATAANSVHHAGTATATTRTADHAVGPKGWVPQHGASHGLVCVLADGPAALPAMWVLPQRTGAAAGSLVELKVWYKPGDHYTVASAGGVIDATAKGYVMVQSLGYVWPPPASANATSRYGLPSMAKDDVTYISQDYWRGRVWTPMLQLVYWGLSEYTSAAARGATDGLVAQSKALLLREWHGYNSSNGYAGTGRRVYENYGADTAEGYAYSSSAAPMYAWGALSGFIGLVHNGFYEPLVG